MDTLAREFVVQFALVIDSLTALRTQNTDLTKRVETLEKKCKDMEEELLDSRVTPYRARCRSRDRRQDVEAPKTVCYYCDGVGHIAARCPEKLEHKRIQTRERGRMRTLKAKEVTDEDREKNSVIIND